MPGSHRGNIWPHESALHGIVVIKDVRIDDRRRRPDVAVLFALNMTIYTKAGDVHVSGDIATWMAEAGVTGIREIRLASSPDALVFTGQRSGPCRHQRCRGTGDDTVSLMWDNEPPRLREGAT